MEGFVYIVLITGAIALFFYYKYRKDQHLAHVRAIRKPQHTRFEHLTPEEQATREAAREDERRRLRQEFARLDKFFDDTTNILTFNPSDFLAKQPYREKNAFMSKLRERLGTWDGLSNVRIDKDVDPFFQIAGSVVSSSRRAYVDSKLHDLSHNGFVFQRVLSDLSDRERAILRLMNKLNVLGVYSNEELDTLDRALIFNGGDNTLMLRHGVPDNQYTWAAAEFVKDYLKQKLPSPGRIMNHTIGRVNQIANQPGDDTVKMMVRDALYTGQHWLVPEDIPGSIYDDKTDASLVLGPLVDHPGVDLQYSGEKSLITIAPPGSGKTQCHVFPNLLRYPGPMFVLDVKGECWDQTHAWRKANVGPVYRFSPLQPDQSSGYNPLWLLPDDPDFVWEEAKLLGHLLVTTQGDHPDEGWAKEGRELLTAIMAWITYLFERQEDRYMGRALDILSDKKDWDKFIDDATNQNDLPELRRTANRFKSMREESDRQFQGVQMGAMQNLGAWQGRRVERATANLDWRPEQLRQAPYPTIYLCINVDEIDAYRSLIRVLIGQHLRALMKAYPDPKTLPVLFMLDEMPRLGYMEPILEALEVGRDKAIRLWMFAQSESQLSKAYGTHADSMIGMTAVRCYMNPMQKDNTARHVSQMLGDRESVLDGRSVPLATEHDLIGTAYLDKQIVFGDGASPAKLTKRFAHKDPAVMHRMGAAPKEEAAAPKSSTLPAPAPKEQRERKLKRQNNPSKLPGVYGSDRVSTVSEKTKIALNQRFPWIKVPAAGMEHWLAWAQPGATLIENDNFFQIRQPEGRECLTWTPKMFVELKNHEEKFAHLWHYASARKPDVFWDYEPDFESYGVMHFDNQDASQSIHMFQKLGELLGSPRYNPGVLPLEHYQIALSAHMGRPQPRYPFKFEIRVTTELNYTFENEGQSLPAGRYEVRRSITDQETGFTTQFDLEGVNEHSTGDDDLFINRSMDQTVMDKAAASGTIQILQTLNPN